MLIFLSAWFFMATARANRQGEPDRVPDALVEPLYPKGLRVSIPGRYAHTYITYVCV